MCSHWNLVRTVNTQSFTSVVHFICKSIICKQTFAYIHIPINSQLLHFLKPATWKHKNHETPQNDFRGKLISLYISQLSDIHTQSAAFPCFSQFKLLFNHIPFLHPCCNLNPNFLLTMSFRSRQYRTSQRATVELI